MKLILTTGLAYRGFLAQCIQQIIGDLERLSNPGAKLCPRTFSGSERCSCVLSRHPERACSN